jgi:hypothetical protein
MSLLQLITLLLVGLLIGLAVLGGIYLFLNQPMVLLGMMGGLGIGLLYLWTQGGKR